MTGKISVAAFRPHPGKEQELLRVINERLPLLRGLGLATDRPEILMRSRDGVIITVSEWTSDDAIEAAHRTPAVHELWSRFAACADPVSLHTLSESHEDFATFETMNP